MASREDEGWLPGYKQAAKVTIVQALNNKGFNIKDKDIMIFTMWRYYPFIFVWTVKCDIQGLTIDSNDNQNFSSQIQLAIQKSRPTLLETVEQEEKTKNGMQKWKQWPNVYPFSRHL